jgi:hypothetical protein
MVADRESDIYSLFAHRPVGLDLIVRVAQNRSLLDGERLFGALHEAPLLATRKVKVAPRGPGDKGASRRSNCAAPRSPSPARAMAAMVRFPRPSR